jgi:non-specific serine/threonine protein kinase
MGGPPMTLGSRAFEILCVLATANGETVSKDQLMAQVWPHRIVEDSNIHVHVSALRKALETKDPKLSCLVTVPGQGYRLVGIKANAAQKAKKIGTVRLFASGQIHCA